MNSWVIAFRLARRELRGGLRGFRVFLACLTLGVAAIAGVGSLSQAIMTGIATDARAILGGDASIRLVHRPIADDQRAYLDDAGDVSTVIDLRAMARKTTGDGQSLIEIKAVDGNYPLYGTFEDGSTDADRGGARKGVTAFGAPPLHRGCWRGWGSTSATG